MVISKRYEMAFAVMGLMFFSGGLGWLENFVPIPTSTLFRYSVLFGSLLFLLQRWRSSLYTAFHGGWVWGIVGLLAFSFLWADSPGRVLTGIRGEFVPMLLLSLYMASRFTLREQFRMVAWMLGISMLLSVLLVFTQPHIAVHPWGPHVGAWKGIFDHKNTFGAYSVLTSGVFFISAIYAQKNKVLMWSLFVLCIVAIFLSTSKTALVLSIVAILVVCLYKNFRWMGTKTVLLLNLSIFLGIGAIGTLVAAWGPILRALGRDPTLTGRTLIWGFLIDYKIPNRPLLGYGRGMFWSNPWFSSGIEAAAHHIPAHAHNGFIDLTLDVGLLGLFFFALAWSVAYAQALKLAYRSQEAAYLWPAVFLTLLLLNNYLESYLTRITNIFWVLFVAIAFSLNQLSSSSSHPSKE